MIRDTEHYRRPGIPVPARTGDEPLDTPPPEPLRASPWERLMTLAGLEDWFQVSREYMKDARTAGLPLVGGRLSPHDAKEWLDAHPDFRAKARRIRAERRNSASIG